MSIVKKKMCWNKKMRHEKAKNKKRPKIWILCIGKWEEKLQKWIRYSLDT